MLRRVEIASLVALALAAAVGYALYPIPPTFDSQWSLVWGREIWDGDLPGFDDYRVPTEHPLWLALSVLLVPLGERADQVLVCICIASFVVTAAGLYVLGKEAFHPLVGATAVLLLLTRLDFPYLAARGFLDATYLALLVWAAVLELREPRRGGAVWWLIAAAGLLRPEAWLIAGLYWLWTCWDRPNRERAIGLAKAAIGPVVWALTDFVVTGDPLYSLHYTTASAEQLGRRSDLIDLPGRTVEYLELLLKWPVLVVALAGVPLAIRLKRARPQIPLALLVTGLVTFFAVSARGFSVIYRYLMPSALALMLFAAVAIAGWVLIDPGRTRRIWAVGSAVAVLGAGLFALIQTNPRYIDVELDLRRDLRTQLTTLRDHPEVAGARRCGPTTVPNHKLVAELRWILDGSSRDVLARSALGPRAGWDGRGVALILRGNTRFMRHPAFGPFEHDGTIEDNPLIQVPSAPWRAVAETKNVVAYVNCPAEA